jgi:hypothetical protein
LKPGDWVKQSIPFSYLSLTAVSQDGSPHNVQVYSGIDGSAKIVLRSPYCPLTVATEWMSGDDDHFSTGLYQRYMPIPEVQYHIIALSDSEQVKFGEDFDQAEWGTLYFAMKNVSDHGSLYFVTHG